MRNNAPLDAMINVWLMWPDVTVEGLSKFIADDCVLHEAESLPYGGVWTGPQGFYDLMNRIKSTWADFAFSFETVLTNNVDLVSYRGRISGSTPHGRFDMPVVEYWRFRDGKAIEILPVYFDTASLVALYKGERGDFIAVTPADA